MSAKRNTFAMMDMMCMPMCMCMVCCAQNSGSPCIVS